MIEAYPALGSGPFELRMVRTEYVAGEDAASGVPGVALHRFPSRSKALESLRGFTPQELTTLRHQGKLETFRDGPLGCVEIELTLTDRRTAEAERQPPHGPPALDPA